MKKRIYKWYLFCWQTGLLEIGAIVPKGAIEIVGDDSKRPLEQILTRARLSRSDGESYFVPGVPEAGNGKFDKINALIKWTDWAVYGRRPAAA